MNFKFYKKKQYILRRKMSTTVLSQSSPATTFTALIIFMLFWNIPCVLAMGFIRFTSSEKYSRTMDKKYWRYAQHRLEYSERLYRFEFYLVNGGFLGADWIMCSKNFYNQCIIKLINIFNLTFYRSTRNYYQIKFFSKYRKKL